MSNIHNLNPKADAPPPFSIGWLQRLQDKKAFGFWLSVGFQNEYESTSNLKVKELEFRDGYETLLVMIFPAEYFDGK